MLTGNLVKKLCLTASLVTVVAFGAHAQEETTLHNSLSVSLKEAVGTGMQTNPEYGEVAANRRATDEELKQGQALYRPSIDAKAETGWEYTDSPSTRATRS